MVQMAVCQTVRDSPNTKQKKEKEKTARASAYFDAHESKSTLRRLRCRLPRILESKLKF
jgi:hypothetical protein